MLEPIIAIKGAFLTPAFLLGEEEEGAAAAVNVAVIVIVAPL